jgi:hypothetical protein
MADPTPTSSETRPPRWGLRSRLLTIAVALIAFAAGLTAAAALSDRPWWEPAPSRSERILGAESADPGGLCSATAWDAADSSNSAFQMRGLTTSPNGSYANAGGCRIRFDIVIDDRPAGSAEVAIETLWAYPREIPWGPANPATTQCTRTLQATPELLDALVAADADLAPNAPACRVRTDTGTARLTGTIWAVRSYGDYRDYTSITLTDLEPGNEIARPETFADFFANELWSVIDSHLPQ